jgi:hypothetical protein
MGSYAANNITSWFAGYDMTGDLNQTQLAIELEALDDTRFGTQAVPTVARQRKPGLEDVQSTVNGFADFADDAVDEQIAALLTGAAHPLTHSPDGAEGSVAYFYAAKEFNVQRFGDVGELTPFTLTAQGSRSNGRAYGAIRGRVLKGVGDISATGATGSVVQVGAVAADQFLYAAVHCFSVGTTFTLQIQSDSASNFPSPTTQMTIGPITAVGGTFATRVAGPITDEFWRVNVSAITGTSQIAASIGIK